MGAEETGWAVTDEPDHRHHCERCGGIWVHADESCVGPRWEGYRTGGSYTCPMCEGRRGE